MTYIASTIDKLLIPAMPQVTFDGNIHVIDNEDDARAAIEVLSREKMVGFDTETRPSFTRGVSNKIALLQLSTLTDAYLFRLNRIGLPDYVSDFLCNPEIIKVGLSVKDDFHSLRKRNHDLAPAGFYEIQLTVARMGIEEKGLQRLYALLFGKRISKGQQLSNWEAEELTGAQCSYAAIDAWSCLILYDYLERLIAEGDYIVFKRNEEGNSEEG